MQAFDAETCDLSDPLLMKIFPGDSELARRMREFDWPATELGGIESWPIHLQHSLSICLLSKFPMCILWGCNHILLYNDAYSSILGPYRKNALGQPAYNVWEDVWHIIGPLLKNVWTTKTATWTENAVMALNSSYPKEEAELTFSYSPILGEEDIDGIFCTCLETTQKYVAMRQLKINYEQAMTQLKIVSKHQLAIENEMLRLAKEEAEKNSNAKDIFLATLSHELRAPITAILCWTHLLKTKPADIEKIKTGILAIEESALAQNNLVNDLLDISSIVLDKIRIELVEVDLIAIINKVIDAIQAAADEKNIQIIFNSDVNELIMPLDPARMRQVFSNLFNNSLKFTLPEGQIKATINTFADYVQIKVEDTGKGIAPEFIPYIFDRFTQADANGLGLGIGLALVRNLLELHGGKIVAESPGVNQGATFTITLPFAGTTYR